MAATTLPKDLRLSWLKSWLYAASLGTLALLALFFSYEAIERWWLRDRLRLESLFTLHIARGVGASIIVSSLSIYLILRMRRAYDRAFATAYDELEAAMHQRSRALEQSQAFNQRLFDALRDRLIVLDKNGTVIKANRVALEAAGGRSPLGRTCSMLGGACSPTNGECAAMRAHKLGRPVVGEQLCTDTRSGRIYSINAYPLPDLDGSGPLVIASARDVTRAKQLETQLLYQEKLAALGVLAAGIAHDIANPLASMSSELEMLEEETDAARAHQSVGVLRGQVDRMNRTLREMTEFARRRGDEVTAVAVGVAVEDALRMVRHDPRARTIKVDIAIADNLPPLYMVEDHLVMVLVNLLINAFDAMPNGGRLEILARRDAGGVTLAITDDGMGMSDDVRRRAIEPMFTTKSGRGTGLGLAVSSDLVQRVGGTLDIQSAVGQGTTVTLRFRQGATSSPPGGEAS